MWKGTTNARLPRPSSGKIHECHDMSNAMFTMDSADRMIKVIIMQVEKNVDVREMEA
jgi:hypothetical protein